MFTNIDEAINWIYKQKSSKYSFINFKKTCEKLGNPQDSFYVIHVAGTNGKGSTVNYIRALLMSQGYKVGTLNSPHYVKHQDRIRVNDQNITDEAFLRILNKNYEFFTSNKLSMFEMDYLIMCEYFKEENVDFAVIEVGLGGRKDSTNVVNNTKLSIITTIGFDHMDRLGNTLAEICTEKCGIIKNNSKVLIGLLDDECTQIVKEIAEERNCEFYKLDSINKIADRRFIFNGETYELSSYADYQINNASLALKALEIIAEDCNFVVDINKAKQAIYNSLWRARFEIVKKDPLVILDGAHNIHGIDALVKSFDKFEGSKCIVFSALKRKEYLKMIEVLNKHCDELIITNFDNTQVIDLKEFDNYKTIDNYIDAIDYAIDNYENILICGSLYFMSEVVLNYKF